jgi:hypothetical protein
MCFLSSHTTARAADVAIGPDGRTFKKRETNVNRRVAERLELVGLTGAGLADYPFPVWLLPYVLLLLLLPLTHSLVGG